MVLHELLFLMQRFHKYVHASSITQMGPYTCFHSFEALLLVSVGFLPVLSEYEWPTNASRATRNPVCPEHNPDPPTVEFYPLTLTLDP